MDAAQIAHALDDVFDQSIVFHGFTDYMRDYEIIVFATADPRTGMEPEHLRYLFKHCVSAVISSALTPDIWRRSLDERLIDYAQGVDLEGYVWGCNWQNLYPGAELIPKSPDATHWARELGIPFHEVRIEANGHNLALVFSDLSVTTVKPGFAPFVVPDSGPDFKIPLS